MAPARRPQPQWALGERFVLGKDPHNTETIWEQMLRRSFWAQGGPVVFGAMSAIDAALWDIKGRAAGLPVHRLLGAETPQPLRCYASQMHLGGTAISRARSKSRFARPYICRLTSLSFVFCPLVWPFDHAVPGAGHAGAHRLRRSMATFKMTGGVSKFQQQMIDGMVANGYPRDFAERTFKQIEGFGSYGFPESHAASKMVLAVGLTRGDDTGAGLSFGGHEPPSWPNFTLHG